MIAAAALLLAAATAQSGAALPAQDTPARSEPRGGAQVVARAVVEILPAARATADFSPDEPRRQVRRNPAGQALVEFE